MKKFALIVAGGSGSRMGSEVPKQFLELCGKPVLMHTLEIFNDFDPACRLILVLPALQQSFWKELCRKHAFVLAHQVVDGGETRFQSVKNGLSCIEGDGVVFIHDGVRPLVSRETLEKCLKTAQEKGNAIPVLPVTESLRKAEGKRNIAVDRSLFFSVQTPQTFRSDQILKAYDCSFDPVFTDDASVAESAGFEINMIDGNCENIKITTPADMIIAGAFMR